LSETLKPSTNLHGDAPAVASPQGLADRKELASVAVERTRMPMVVTNPREEGNPIVLANKAFLDLTGYAAEEIIGRNCRFLQGPGSSEAAIAEIRAALADERELNVEILNYRKNGTTFWNQLRLCPVHGDDGQLLYYFGSQDDVTRLRKVQTLEASEHRLLREVDHRARNALTIVNSIVQLSRADDATLYATAVQQRVQALARAHGLLADHGWREIPLDQLVRAEVSLFGDRAITLDGPEMGVPAPIVQPLALVIHELVVNAATHGALSRRVGKLNVSWQETSQDDGFELRWQETGGPPPPLRRQSGFGTVMVDGMINKQLRGRIVRHWIETGLTMTITIPGSP
jgi:PAS domain S-box-containing protein